MRFIIDYNPTALAAFLLVVLNHQRLRIDTLRAEIERLEGERAILCEGVDEYNRQRVSIDEMLDEIVF